MPPSRRRPIPSPPAGGRPKVAGLSRRASRTAEPEDVAADAAASTEPTEDVAVEEAPLKAPTAVEWTPPVTKRPKSKAAADAPAPTPSKASQGAGEAKPAPPWLLPAALVAVAVLLAGLGAFFHVKSRAVSYDAALVDPATTSEVNGQVREAVEKSFSYNFADIAATENAAKELLTGKALCQYNAVFGPVKELAPKEKLIVTVRVVSSAVSSLKDGKSTVLVFVDQVTTRTTDNTTSGGTAMLRVSAEDAGSRWKIDNLELFGATPEQARQMQGC